ncbi:MAG: hypothetical protein KGM24_13960, partial [Elusimicrobia bacterium]|nr:hypothetical protein [Elusimicrobiota bacterium]
MALRPRLAAALLAALAAAPARAARIVVVAPSGGAAPYREAIEGVCAALGRCPPVLAPGDPVPDDARVVVAIGGRAARGRYPARDELVTLLDPGYEAARGARVQLELSPDEFVRRLRARLPGARRVALLWSGRAFAGYVARLRGAASAAGLKLLAVAAGPARMPETLRALPAADAVWLAPDPDLVTPTIFDEILVYARSRGLVFFAPAPGLAARGADPALAPSFRAQGYRAGEAA